MQDQQTINQVELALYNAFHRQYILFPEEATAEKVSALETLVNESRSVNYHIQLFSVEEITKQWNRIRINDTVATSLLSITTDFVSELELNGIGFDNVVNALAKSVGIINRPKSVIDKVLTERTPSVDDLKTMLSDNVWVIALYYIARSVHIYNLYLAAANTKSRGNRS